MICYARLTDSTETELINYVFLYLIMIDSSELRRRFCRCVLGVQRTTSSKAAAYAICTKSVYGTRGLRRTGLVACDLERKTAVELRELARTRGVPARVRRRWLRKGELIRALITDKIRKRQSFNRQS